MVRDGRVSRGSRGRDTVSQSRGSQSQSQPQPSGSPSLLSPLPPPPPQSSPLPPPLAPQSAQLSGSHSLPSPLPPPPAQSSSLPPPAPQSTQLLGSRSPIVGCLDSGPSETDDRLLITLVYSDGRPTKFEPHDVTRNITKTLLQYIPGPIAQWKEYPKEVLEILFQTFLRSYRFATKREEADARSVWDKVAAKCFADYLSKNKAAAKKAASDSYDPLMWKGHGPSSLRMDYWDAMCDVWATEHYQQRSTVAADDRGKMPEVNLHTSGSISFGSQKRKLEQEKDAHVSYKELFEHTHREKDTDDFISQKAENVMESYSQEIVERDGDNATAWLVATGQPKKGRVFGLGSDLDAGGLISSSQCSGGSTIAARTLPQSGGLTDVRVREIVVDVLHTFFSQTLGPALQIMGVPFRSSHVEVSSGASYTSPMKDENVQVRQNDRGEEDDV